MSIVESRYAVAGWGVGEIRLSDGVLLEHDFRYGPVPAAGADPVSDSGSEELISRFRGFLAGEDVRFDDVVIDLEWATPLQRALAEALRSIPRGELVSYGELAALAGRPRAPRAAGAFCATNGFAFVVPCHRVVAANGIGGYGDAGVEIKRRLLALEGVVL